MIDYYRILGIPLNASQAEVRKAYFRAARQWHPDKNKDNEIYASLRFKEIGNAFSILSDPVKRRKYQQEFEAWTSHNSYRKQGSYRPKPTPPKFHNEKPKSQGQESSQPHTEGSTSSSVGSDQEIPEDVGQFSFVNSLQNLVEQGGNLLKEGQRIYRQFLFRGNEDGDKAKTTSSEYSFAKSKTAYCFNKSDQFRDSFSRTQNRRASTNILNKPTKLSYDDFGTPITSENPPLFPPRRHNSLQYDTKNGRESKTPGPTQDDEPLEVHTSEKLVDGKLQVTTTTVYFDKKVTRVCLNGLLTKTIIHHTPTTSFPC